MSYIDEMTADSVVEFAEFQYHPATGELRREGVAVPLEPLPTRVLTILIERAGLLVTRSQLIEGAWPPETTVSDRSLNTCIREIRTALGDDAGTPRFVETVPRRGYRFIAPLNSSTATHGPGRWSRSRVVLGGASVLAALGVLGWAALNRPTPPVRLLVLPITQADTDAVVADAAALSEDVTSRLARLPIDDINVIGTTTANHYANLGLSAGALGDSLAVDYVVEGSLRSTPAGSRVSLRIVRVRDEALIWAEEFTGAGSGAATAVSAVVHRVTQLVIPAGGAVSGTETGDRGSPQARRAVLKGRYLLRTHDAQDRRAGEQFFREALAIDSTTAEAYAGLAEVAMLEQRWEQARSLAERAVLLDPDTPVAHVVLGTVSMLADWDWRAAEAALARAVALAPGEQAPLHAQAFLYLATGQTRMAVASMELLHNLDPMSAVVLGDLGHAYYWAGDFDKAIEYCAEAAELSRQAAWAWDCQFQAAVQARNRALAESALVELTRLVDSTARVVDAGQSLDDLARTYARWLLGRPETERDGYRRALAYADLGQTDSAVRHLLQAAERREMGTVLTAIEPRTRRLRGIAGFDSLLRRMNLHDVPSTRTTH